MKLKKKNNKKKVMKLLYLFSFLLICCEIVSILLYNCELSIGYHLSFICIEIILNIINLICIYKKKSIYMLICFYSIALTLPAIFIFYLGKCFNYILIWILFLFGNIFQLCFSTYYYNNEIENNEKEYLLHESETRTVLSV